MLALKSGSLLAWRDLTYTLDLADHVHDVQHRMVTANKTQFSPFFEASGGRKREHLLAVTTSRRGPGAAKSNLEQCIISAAQTIRHEKQMLPAANICHKSSRVAPTVLCFKNGVLTQRCIFHANSVNEITLIMSINSAAEQNPTSQASIFATIKLHQV